MRDKFVWIDMEMSGLCPNKDVVLEIATIITDNKLNPVAEGPSIVVSQPESVLLGMDEWNTKHHKQSGLWDKVLNSETNTKQAEEQTLNFLKEHTKHNSSPLCGNSVWQDRSFLYNYMPSIVDHLHYRIVDVSTIKLLASHWNCDIEPFVKKNEHRALDDIKESIEELRHYQTKLFNK